MTTAKEQARKVIRKLPDDCSIEDIQYHLYVLDVIRKRIEQADKREFVPDGEVEKRLAKWLTD